MFVQINKLRSISITFQPPVICRSVSRLHESLQLAPVYVCRQFSTTLAAKSSKIDPLMTQYRNILTHSHTDFMKKLPLAKEKKLFF
jgi:hypothetical protein